MYIYIYVYVYEYGYVYDYVCIYTYIYIYIHIHLCTWYTHLQELESCGRDGALKTVRALTWNPPAVLPVLPTLLPGSPVSSLWVLCYIPYTICQIPYTLYHKYMLFYIYIYTYISCFLYMYLYKYDTYISYIYIYRNICKYREIESAPLSSFPGSKPKGRLVWLVRGS